MKKQGTLIKFVIIFILLVITYLPTFKWMIERFEGAESYYSHGYLVPFITLGLIYWKREKLKQLKAASSGIDLLLIAAALLTHAAGLILKIGFVSGASLLMALFGLSLYLGGAAITKELFFPVSFLIFMVPMPRMLTIHISFKMKLLAAQAGTVLINWLGITAVRHGSIVHLPNTSLTIGSPCSGLRSLIALCGLGALFAYVADLPRFKKAILFLASIPLAFGANILRITMLLWVARKYGHEVATGKFHDYSGMFVFVFALAGLILINKALQWEPRKQST